LCAIQSLAVSHILPEVVCLSKKHNDKRLFGSLSPIGSLLAACIGKQGPFEKPQARKND
jgi:hypothetical protein